jgi:hypothetical protein
MHPEVPDSSPCGEVEVKLDGILIEVPSERRSLTAIRSYLESLALQQQRILCALCVDDRPVSLSQCALPKTPFTRVEGESIGLGDVPVQLLKAALQQTAAARLQLQSAVTQVLINDLDQSREVWWAVSAALKEPLLTLSLLPETLSGPANGSASLLQLRKWQLQQLGCVIRDVDEVCRSGDTAAISDALEKRALPWLEALRASLELWHDTISPTPLQLSAV